MLIELLKHVLIYQSKYFLQLRLGIIGISGLDSCYIYLDRKLISIWIWNQRSLNQSNKDLRIF